MYQAEALLPVARAIKNAGYTLWCYTGFTFEQLLERPDATALLSYIDALVDGPFIQARRNTGLRFRGSDNQRIIDVQASLVQSHRVVELAEYYS